MPDKFKYSQDEIQKLLDGIYSGTITEYEIPEKLYLSIADYLKESLYKGFGGTLTDFKGKDLELLKDLRENVYLFSGGKSYQQIKEYRSLLLNENGELRSQREFTQLGEKAFETWNEAWGLSERNTAIHNATMANKWNEIEKNKDLLPFLVYSTIGDACDICAPLDGFTAKVDDPAWSSVYPTNHFNCLCIVTQEEDATETADKSEVLGKVESEMSDVFKMNSGKDRELFSKDHPYFDVPKKDVEYAKNNFNLPIPSVESETAGKVKQFVEAKTIKEAESFARNELGIPNVNFKGLTNKDISIANEMNKSVAYHLENYPELKETLNFTGTAQGHYEIQFNKNLGIYRERMKAYYSRPEDIERSAVKFAKKFTSKTPGNAYALSYSDEFKGIGWNAKYKPEVATDLLKRDVASKFHPIGTDNIKSVMDHEMGHRLDSLLGFRANPEFRNYHDSIEKLTRADPKYITDNLSTYAYRKGKPEFIAEAWAEYLNNPNPREIAQKVGKMIIDSYSKKHIL